MRYKLTKEKEYKEIKDGDKFKLLNSFDYIYDDSFNVKTTRGVIKTRILTDGDIKSITKLYSEKISLFKELSTVRADLEEINELELINHNYVIKVLIENEQKFLNNREAFFEVIKNVEVYIRDKKDKEALKNIKETLNIIYGNKNTQRLSYEKKEYNVYQLIK